MNDKNVSGVVDPISKTGKILLDNFDNDLYNTIQPYLNKLYAGKYGDFFSYMILDIPLANLIMAGVVFVFFLTLRRFFTLLLTRVLLRMAKKTRTMVDEIIIREIRSPLEFLFVIIGIHLFFKLIFRESDLVKSVLEGMLIFDIYWILYSMTPAIKELLYDYGRHRANLSYELINFIVKMLKLLIVFMGVISILYNFGVNVTAFLASLGLGGLAFALAAKDTAANLFGSIALMLDESIRIGEWIRVNEVEGTVEDIGMRTTKIRTFEKSFVVVPNSIVANSNIENFSRRGIRRIKMYIGLTYDTGRERLESITRDIRAMLDLHPNVAENELKMAYFNSFNESDLGIMVYLFVKTSRWEEYLKIKEDINLRIMSIVEHYGASFAFPSQSVYVESLPDGILARKESDGNKKTNDEAQKRSDAE